MIAMRPPWKSTKGPTADEVAADRHARHLVARQEAVRVARAAGALPGEVFTVSSCPCSRCQAGLPPATTP